MSKYFLVAFICIIILVFIANQLQLIYFPLDILNLFPLFHSHSSVVPHNTLVSDPVFQFEPWRYLSKQMILNGQFPFWNSYNAAGVPLFANSQSAILFPLNLLYLIFPITIALNLILLLKFFLLFCFSFLYLRSIGLTSRNSLIGGVAVIFSGFPILWSLWPHTNVFLFLPLFLYVTEKIKKSNKKSTYRWYVILSISYLLAILGGHYETLMHIMLLHFPYIIFRFYRNRKKIVLTMFFIFFGFLLASVQLFPFIEYLIQSEAFVHRMHLDYLYLPLQSGILNFIPFLLGAPHLQYYKPILPITNFQESMNGYTGIIVLMTALVGMRALFTKKKMVRFWAIVAFTFWVLAFKIWPLGLLLDLPIISQAQNSRFPAVASFAIVVIFSYALDSLSYVVKRRGKLLKIVFSAFLLFILLTLFVIGMLRLFTDNQMIRHPFIMQLIFHLLYLFASTGLFLFIIRLRKTKVFSFLLMILIFAQTMALLAGYIPLVSAKQYYPTAPVIRKLQSMPAGVLLEVGNPSIPPDTNIMYGIFHAQNYDGIELRSYKEAFDKAFNVKNHWGKVENFTLNNLQRFNIRYLLTDYDVNSKKQILQGESFNLLGPLMNGDNLELNFLPADRILSEIRLITANYNRKNSCDFDVSIVEEASGVSIFRKKISCADLLDKMYYTIETGGIAVDYLKQYVLIISPNNTNTENSFGLWGNNNTPFVQLLYQSSSGVYSYVGKYKNVKLFEVPGSGILRYKGTVGKIRDNNNSLSFQYSSRSSSNAEIKKVYYPGWKATIDGEVVQLEDKNPFIGIYLPSGSHTVRLYYHPDSFYTGLLLSCITFLLLGAYYIRGWILQANNFGSRKRKYKFPFKSFRF